MLSGIKFREMVIGTGAVAERGKVVRVRIALLNPGEERPSVPGPSKGDWVHLGKREVSVGVERGIEGMRVGGRRELVIRPHLAGAWGRAGEAVRVEVELLELRDSRVRRPEDYPPGKHLSIFRPGEAARGLSRWQIDLLEHGLGRMVFTHPQPGLQWRHARPESVAVRMEPKEAAAVFESVLATPGAFPQECLSNEECWADSSEPANSIPRVQRTNTPCLWVAVSERGRTLCNFYLREDSPALLGSRFYQIVSSYVNAHLRTKPEAQPERPARGTFRWSDD
jgi:peptidylprolyl isomerase